MTPQRVLTLWAKNQSLGVVSGRLYALAKQSFFLFGFYLDRSSQKGITCPAYAVINTTFQLGVIPSYLSFARTPARINVDEISSALDGILAAHQTHFAEFSLRQKLQEARSRNGPSMFFSSFFNAAVIASVLGLDGIEDDLRNALDAARTSSDKFSVKFSSQDIRLGEEALMIWRDGGPERFREFLERCERDCLYKLYPKEATALLELGPGPVDFLSG